MRLVQYVNVQNGSQCIGAQVNNGNIIKLTGSALAYNSIVELLAAGDGALGAAKAIIADASQHIVVDKSQIKLLSPITKCEKIVCIGLNYKDHCEEQNLPLPEEPVVFSKFPSAICADGDTIILPNKVSQNVDWEVELAVIIGKQGKHITQDRAMDHVAGYTVANDVSTRDWQMKKNAGQWLLGKTFDTHCPLGPALVTKDEIADPYNLKLKCIVNGQEVQNSNTKELVFNISECIAWVSQFFTLKPGDILLTGTPPGVGVFRKPPVFLKAGDTVTCEVESVGKITNSCANEF